MPPIDPAVLRARTTALAGQFGQPGAVVSAVRALLDDYADRSHRASPKVATSAVENQYKAPAPVVRAIAQALRGPARASPEAALAIAAGLWAGGSREERRLAAELLEEAGPLRPEAALEQASGWVRQIESGETADVLAEHGLGPLIRANPAAYLERAQRWVSDPHRWVRRFGLAVLLPLVKDRYWDNVPAALNILRLVMAETDGEVRRTAAILLTHLAAKSPAEIGYFLREQAARSNTYTHWIIRHAMAGLSPAQQAELNKILRG